MRKPVVFNHVSVDGKFTGVNGDFSWAHEGSGDPEFASFLAANASRGGEVLFGRPGKGMAILGSGSIVSQLAAAGLIDEHQVVVNPVALGKGRPLFEGVPHRVSLRLTQTRAWEGLPAL